MEDLQEKYLVQLTSAFASTGTDAMATPKQKAENAVMSAVVALKLIKEEISNSRPGRSW